MEWIAYGVPTLVLAAVLIYAVMRTGRLRRGDRAQVDQNAVRPRRGRIEADAGGKSGQPPCRATETAN